MELQSIDHSRVLIAAGALCCDVWNCSPWITAECFSGMQFLQCCAGTMVPLFDLLILFQCLCDGVSRRWSRSHLCLVLRVGMQRCVETVVSLLSLSGASCGHATVCRDGGLAPVRVWCFVWACDGASRRWSRSRACLQLCTLAQGRPVRMVILLPPLAL
jgi:hypothetical protein